MDDGSATRDRRGEWAPRVQGVGPLLDWPWKPLRVLRYLVGFPGFIWPFTALHAGIAVATWYFLQPGARYSLPSSVTGRRSRPMRQCWRTR